MKLNIERKELIVIVISTICAIISIFIGVNVLLIIGCILLLGLISIYMINHEKILLITTLFLSIFNGTIADIESILQIIPIYCYALMLVSVLLRKKCKVVYRPLLVIASITVLTGIIPYMYIEFNILSFIIGLFKRFNYIIILIYSMNCNLYKFNVKKFIYKFSCAVMIFNIPIVIIQFIGGSRSDDLVGILGSNSTGEIGCLLTYCLIMIFEKDYEGKSKSFNIIAAVIIVILYSALAEVKIGFVTACILIFFYMIIRKNKIININILIFILILIGVSYIQFVKIYPDHDFLSREFLQNYLYSMEYGENTVNRLSFVRQLNDNILTTGEKQIFGTGIGSANPSRVSILSGNINKNFDHMKYYWFATAYTYLEGGWIGLIGIIFIQIIILIKFSRMFFKFKDGLYMSIALFTSMNIIFIFYSSTFLEYSISTIYWIIVGVGLRKCQLKT